MKKGDYTLLFFDWLAALAAWLFFFVYRKRVEQPQIANEEILQDDRLFIGLVIIPLVWLLLWSFLGLYKRVYRKSRLQVMYLTVGGTFLGALGLLFTVIRDDTALSLITYLRSFVVVFFIHVVLFVIVRLILLTFYKWQLIRGHIKFNGILAVDDAEAAMPAMRFTTIDKVVKLDEVRLHKSWSDIESIALISDNKAAVNDLTPYLIGTSMGRDVFVGEDTFELLDYDYKGTPFLRDNYIALQTDPMWPWQRNGKRCIDVFVSLFMIIILSPVYLWLYIKVKASSDGPVLFRQERLGQYGLPFIIYKYRSMYEDAEKDGPALAIDEDERCTPFGKWMRTWRLDELPQFFNVLRGEMSLVGPRPERAYFAEKLLERNSKYALLWQVKPGITSWGMIKFGYASDIGEMLKRFRYDLLYVERMSILLDLRILYYTMIVLIQGRGR